MSPRRAIPSPSRSRGSASVIVTLRPEDTRKRASPEAVRPFPETDDRHALTAEVLAAHLWIEE